MRAGLFALFLGLATPSVFAQPPNPGASPEPDSKHSGAPFAQFTAGPFVITPTFKIGTIAIDTNVLYTQERKTDLLASLGPGLDIALPFLDHWKLDVQGASQYFYFHRNEQLRQWTGGGTAALLWRDTGTQVSVQGGVRRDFSRLNFEVDSRVATDQRFAGLALERNLGRLTLVGTLSFAGSRVLFDQEFRGADLASALTTDRFSGGGDFRYRLTPVTALLFEGGYEQTRFPRATTRNYSEKLAGVGILTAGLLKGRLSAGVRRSQLLTGTDTQTRPYFRADLAQNLGRRFILTGRYSHESTVSAFATNGTLPTFEHRSVDLTLTIAITGRIDVRLGGTRDRIISDGLIQVILDDGTVARAERNDISYIGRGDVGIRLGRARVAAFASYTTRESLFFQDFGIDGLQVGARVEYAPGR